MTNFIQKGKFWTVDWISAFDFEYEKPSGSAAWKSVEVDKHIIVDLNDYSALQILVNATGRELDVVTTGTFLGVYHGHAEGFAVPPSHDLVWGMASVLLRSGGIYFDAFHTYPFYQKP